MGAWVSRAEYETALSRIARLERMLSSGLGPGLENVGGRGLALKLNVTSCMARITAHTSEPAVIPDYTGQSWVYSWEEVEVTGSAYSTWTAKANGRSGTEDAYNLAETIDHPLTSGLIEAAWNPVPTGTIIQLTLGLTQNWFSFSMNQDVLSGLVAYAHLALTLGTQDTDDWVQGESGASQGVDGSALTDLEGQSNGLHIRSRKQIFDNGGRLLAWQGESATSVAPHVGVAVVTGDGHLPAGTYVYKYDP